MGARNMLQNEYGINLPVLSINNMLHNPMYKGVYRDNQNYCEPIVSAELFDQIQDELARRATRQTPSGVVYLFSGLIVCRECGKRMCGGINYSTARKIPYYRCPTHYMRKSCDNKTAVREYKIEQYLVSHLSELLANIEAEYTVEKKKVEKRKVNKKDVLKKLDRLKDLYVDGLITKDQYKADYDKFNALLAEESVPKRPRFDAVRKLIGANFEADYSSISQPEKKQFWRAVLDHIEMDKDGNLFIYFRQ